MKKTALLLVIVLTLSLFMTSCQPVFDTIGRVVDEVGILLRKPDSAAAVWKNVDTRMSLLSSYEANLTLDLDLEYSGLKITGDAIAREIKINEYYYHSERQSLKIDGSNEKVSERLVAYTDGTLYTLHSENNVYSKFCSPISFEDFEEFYLNDANSSVSIPEMTEAFTQTFTKNDDSTWTLVFDDFPKSSIADMSKDFGFNNSIFGEITDITVKVIADSKYRAKEMELSIYNDSGDEPMASINIAYSNYNDAEKVDFNTDGYVEIEDARFPEMIQKSMQGKVDQPFGKFTLVVAHTAYIPGAGTQSLLTESDKVTFYNNYNGTDRFYFDVDSTYNGSTIKMTFENGVLKTIAGASSAEEEMDDVDARDIINQIINSVGYAPYMVKSIEKQTDDTYKLTCKVSDVQTYKDIAKQLGIGSYQNYSLEIIVRMSGDEVDMFQSNLVIHCTRANYIVKNTYDFTLEEPTEEPEGGKA